MDQQLYARVHQGKVVELNVTRLQIADRGETVANYVPLYYDFEILNVPKFHYVKESAEVFPTHVQIHNRVLPMDIEHLLVRVWNTNGDLRKPIASVVIGDIPVDMVDAISTQASIYVQGLLDGFAKTHSFDDIKSAVTYVDSSIPAFAADGARAKLLRDQTWNSLYAYIASVKAGTTPVPKNVTDITSTCPALTWA